MSGKIFRKAIFTILLLTSAIALCNAQSNELKASIERGKEIYATNCQNCHMAKGEGVGKVYPPLANSDYLMEDVNRSIEQVLNGTDDDTVIDGVNYSGQMTAFDMLSNQQIADVLNYIRNSWGNDGEMVTPKQVEKVRKE